MTDKELLLRTNQLLERLASLLEKRRQYDVLLEASLRLSARWLWLRLKSEAATAPLAEAREPLSELPATLLDRLEQELEAESAKADGENPKLKQQIDRVAAMIAKAEQFLQGTAPSPKVEDRTMDAAQSALLEFVCLRNDVIQGGTQLTPTGHATGVGRRSAIYFIDVPYKHFAEPLHLIAKFDEPERALREWEAIRHMRLLNLPHNIILPQPYSHREDGVILYDAAWTPDSARSQTLADYLRENLKTAPMNCCVCFTAAFELLGHLYRIHPGEFRDWNDGIPLKWRDVLPEAWSELRSESTGYLLEVCRQHWGGLKWEEEKWFSRHLKWDLPRSLPNPVEPVVSLLRARTPKLLLSRIHGDLNLTNLLVSTFQDGTPEKVFVIDLANSERDRPAALDFARLEVALWLEIFLGHALGQNEFEEADWLCDLIHLRDYLDGRAATVGDLHSAEVSEFGKVVTAVRHHAFLMLAPNANGPARDHYAMSDYFHCLYFTFLSMLRYKELGQNEFQVRAMLVSASLALQLLGELNNYSPVATNPFRRPWEHPPQ